MQHVDGCAFDFDEVGFGESPSPGLSVHVAADRGYRGDFFKCGEDFGVAYVAGVKDLVYSLESGLGFGAEQAVGVGDEAEEHGLFEHGRLECAQRDRIYLSGNFVTFLVLVRSPALLG